MGKYWLMNRHGADGPTALIETDGSMRIVDVLRFGPDVADLEAQQKVWDEVIGRVAPTMKPLVALSKVSEDGIEPHPDLQHGDGGSSNTRGHDESRHGAGAGRGASGAKRTGGRGRG